MSNETIVGLFVIVLVLTPFSSVVALANPIPNSVDNSSSVNDSISENVPHESPRLNSNNPYSNNSTKEVQRQTESLPSWDWTVLENPGWRFIYTVNVDPHDSSNIFVGTVDGLWVSHDGGKTWDRKLKGLFQAIEFDPDDSNTIYTGSTLTNEFYKSTDGGDSWKLITKFRKGDTDGFEENPGDAVRSIFVGKNGTVLVGVQNDEDTDPGIWRSTNNGKTWELVKWEGRGDLLIPWDIEKHPKTGRIFIPIEIADHPEPYDAPILASDDNGKTWHDISGPIDWHSTDIEISNSGVVYTKVEYTTGGLYKSVNNGKSWQDLPDNAGFWDFEFDPKNQSRIYAGGIERFGGYTGLWVSTNRGKSFRQIGLDGYNVSSLRFAEGGSKLVFETGDEVIIGTRDSLWYSEYVNKNKIVDETGLNAAVYDYLHGDLKAKRLNEVIKSYLTGEPIT